MDKALSILRFILSKLLTLLFANLVIFSILAITFGSILGNRDNIKGWLNESGIYETLPEIAFDLIEREASGEDESIQASLDAGFLDGESVKRVVLETYSGEFLRTGAETVIDGVYDWLDGVTEEPTFTVSLAGRAQEFAMKLSTEIKTQLATFPDCQPAQLSGAEFDPLTAECIPPGVDVAANVNQIVAEIATSSDSPLQSATISGNDFLRGDNGDNDIPEFVEDIPFYIGVAKTAVLWLPIITLAFFMLVVITGKDIAAGFKVAAAVMVSSALISMVIFFGLSRLGSNLPNSGDVGVYNESEQRIFDEIVEPLSDRVFSSVASLGYAVAGVVIALGVASWFVGFFMRRHGKKHQQTDKEEALVDDSKKETEKSEHMTPHVKDKKSNKSSDPKKKSSKTSSGAKAAEPKSSSDQNPKPSDESAEPAES